MSMWTDKLLAQLIKYVDDIYPALWCTRHVFGTDNDKIKRSSQAARADLNLVPAPYPPSRNRKMLCHFKRYAPFYRRTGGCAAANAG